MMHSRVLLTLALALAGILSGLAHAQTSDDMPKGQALWQQAGQTSPDGKIRRCTTCHGADLTRSGRHVRTGKHIDPMAPSVQSDRFSKPKKVEKWFLRNCKWTWGRTCSKAEKTAMLNWLKQL